MHLQQLSNISTPTFSAAPIPSSSFRIPESFYNSPPPQIPMTGNQLVLNQPPSEKVLTLPISDESLLRKVKPQEVYAARPTPVLLTKRQVVVEIEIVAVVTVVPKYNPQANPVVVTVTAPPPTQTGVSQGGWPIINPGSAAACWSDYACNSVCPNFQQNGWYAHCMDAACTQCRCQIIASSMCNGQAWMNATWSSNSPSKTTNYGPAVATVTVVVNSSNVIFTNQISRRAQLLSVFVMAISLVGCLSL